MKIQLHLGKQSLYDFKVSRITILIKVYEGFCNSDKLAIRSLHVHSDTEYRPIESPVSHLLQNLVQSVVLRATTLFTIG